jgi:hypothetical protein
MLTVFVNSNNIRSIYPYNRNKDQTVIYLGDQMEIRVPDTVLNVIKKLEGVSVEN